ncbi:hypothetical protein P168DRAFT_1004 [Aspergillus campestris IBT 28561]|uniref:Uncharacterized protein n=1 Tax=Aspergillus campestris (strain IBT 28561) TaxID=1392248 RepID=A0A2I1DCW7_ASPC2|nr:uncharacterized protein P168DRAFT_1004 [Aspergillus campestris IBT 28561]PKY07717.1 hypothetical protein P168DRAFT_1004 [Aspergillus campestris IBT 28561]
MILRCIQDTGNITVHRPCPESDFFMIINLSHLTVILMIIIIREVYYIRRSRSAILLNLPFLHFHLQSRSTPNYCSSNQVHCNLTSGYSSIT